MNQQQRREYAAKHERAVKRMESPFHKLIARAIHMQILEVTDVLRTHGITAALAANERYIVNLHLKGPIERMYKVFGLYQARKTTREINKSARAPEQKAGFGFDAEWLKEIIAYLQQHVFNRVVLPITQTTRERILAKLIEGEEKGWGVDQILRELEHPDMTVSRARTIVRTESLKALEFGKTIAGEKSRWQYVSQWISARDHRTRHSHRIIDGETVDEGGRFAVPIFKGKVQIGVDMMRGPGDPQASAGNVINCRCSLVTVAKRDKKGRLILKQTSRISVLEPEGLLKPVQSGVFAGAVNKPAPAGIVKENVAKVQAIKVPADVYMPDTTEEHLQRIVNTRDALLSFAQKVRAEAGNVDTSEVLEITKLWSKIKEVGQKIGFVSGSIEMANRNIGVLTQLQKDRLKMDLEDIKFKRRQALRLEREAFTFLNKK